MTKSSKVKRSKPATAPSTKGFRKFVQKPDFGNAYMLLAIAILLITTAVWATLSAHVQWNNADQTVNSLLFDHTGTFRGAMFPGQHSSLIKWPMFWLIKLFGYSQSTFATFTAAISLLTVSLLALLLYRIERRPIVFGTLCLALASTLLLIPAQPYTGGLLPINMAMLTTRNIEYIIYILGLYLLVRSEHLKSWSFWLGTGCLALLFASDKLFLTLSLGGALFALLIYAVAQAWHMVTLSVNWLLGSLAAAVGSLVILWFIQAAHITHIVSQSTTGPYAVTHSVHQWLLGSAYAVLSLATNFGANPGFDATVLRNVPHQILEGLIGPSGISYVINLAILLVGLVACWYVLRPSFAHTRSRKNKLDDASKLSIMLIWSSVVAVGAFIATNHYFAVDARYLTIIIFAFFVSGATYTRQKNWKAVRLVVVGAVLVIGMLLGMYSVNKIYKQQNAAFDTITQRNSKVAQVLAHHPESTLVGDYWRVIPTKLTANININVLPLSSCTEARNTLTSQAWQPDLTNHGFAYLLTLSGSMTDFPNCSLKQVLSYYGRPNASSLIAGTLDKPEELLLFYDHGIQNSAPTTAQPAAGPSTVVPIAPDELPYTSCPVPTIMNIVAHEDDDLLFINPDTLHSINAGDCVRTVYITAGDAGTGELYWLGRERGSEVAYSQMAHADSIWVQRIVKLADNQFITVANPRGNSKISLIFMHLPDGNVKGQGFQGSHNESLANLEAGKVRIIHAVDGQSSYSSEQLINGLKTLMFTYQPTEIRTQNPVNASTQYPDHSDHMAVGRYVQRTYKEYEKQQYDNNVTIPLHFYIGYPIHQMPVNVFGADLAAKEAAWYAYSKFDGSVCQTIAQCSANPAYGAYLPRQYQAH
ncbi:MAG TPA: PIG-L family deacetylase [Patescibacteria group bacterium]|nr:PIG-L family deacetylase [Patescibacteria group bacterium]